jgi:Sigma-70, region 4
MASLDNLPPDQRAVLDLVLRRGRSYDDIARLLAIDRAAVRTRALAAFDGIGPDTGLAPESRALITDYLLGQLPDKVAEQTRDRLAESPYERAWARVLASELSSVASKPLPEIPEGTARARAGSTDAKTKATSAEPATGPTADAKAAGGPERDRAPGRRIPRPTDRPSSRRGGVIFLLAGTVVVIVVVVVLIVVLSGGKSNKPSSTGNAAANAPTSSISGSSTTTPAGTATTGTATTGTTTTGTTGTSTVKPKVIAQVNMNPPSGGAAKGAALIVQEGTAIGVIIAASGLKPNSNNAYAVWLSNTPTDSARVGFVKQKVGTNGKLETGGALPANASHYSKLLLTLETQNAPKTPGPVVLQGTLKIPATS